IKSMCFKNFVELNATLSVGGDGSASLWSECFAVFQGPSDFTAAQTECADKKGHLMTVRSSVSHDTFSILLGSLSERFWIGLHLPSGCPDASAKLRGFQWVTGDSESDYYNWAPTFDSSCSPQCVSVSRGDNFTWATEPCDQPAAGYLCEFKEAHSNIMMKP
uniref:C-type lectin domain-containing protein n=1 Tax=Myripristis murdjan TaxID=586833 RepID=A0A667YCX8_9TELE